MLTTLLISYILNGVNINTSLLSTSVESCMQDARIAETVVRSIGAINVVSNCTSN